MNVWEPLNLSFLFQASLDRVHLYVLGYRAPKTQQRRQSINGLRVFHSFRRPFGIEELYSKFLTSRAETAKGNEMHVRFCVDILAVPSGHARNTSRDVGSLLAPYQIHLISWHLPSKSSQHALNLERHHDAGPAYDTLASVTAGLERSRTCILRKSKVLTPRIHMKPSSGAIPSIRVPSPANGLLRAGSMKLQLGSPKIPKQHLASSSGMVATAAKLQ